MTKIKTSLFAVSFVFSGFAAALVPDADIKQTHFCSGITADTKVTTDGYYLVFTSLYLELGPIGNKDYQEFYDEDHWGYAFTPASEAFSTAGCADCLPEYSRYPKVALSEHFWQEEDTDYFRGYCPGATAYGSFSPGDYCKMLQMTHPACTVM